MKLTEYDMAPNKQEYLAQFFADAAHATVPASVWHSKALRMVNTSTAQEIADACGVKKDAVNALLRRRGLKALNRRQSIADAKMYVKLHKKGLKRAEIAQRMGCTASRVDTLKRVAREIGCLQ